MLEVALESETGRRSENQDRLEKFESEFGSVFVLADGMGGHQSGSVASELVISACEDILRKLPSTLTPEQALLAMTKEVNRLVFDESRGVAAHRGMGSTLVVLLVTQTEDGLLAIGAHVGDSRLYFLRGGRIFRLTEDHSLVQQMLRDGTLTESQAQSHPHSSVLTRSLGHRPDVAVDLTSWILLQPGDVMLLCSDGLSGYVDDEEIARIIGQDVAVQQLAYGLIELAFTNGSEDNISVLVVKVTDKHPPVEWSGAD